MTFAPPSSFYSLFHEKLSFQPNFGIGFNMNNIEINYAFTSNVHLGNLRTFTSFDIIYKGTTTPFKPEKHKKMNL